MDVAAVLLLGVAKADGAITTDQKRELLALFQSEFQIGRNEASDLLLASSHLTRDEIYLVDHLDKILERSASKFGSDEVASLLRMMRTLAVQDGAMNAEQEKLINAADAYFAARAQQPRKWG